MKVYCNTNYYGSDCATFCGSRDDALGHYTCNPSTGSKICLHGKQCSVCMAESEDI